MPKNMSSQESTNLRATEDIGLTAQEILKKFLGKSLMDRESLVATLENVKTIYLKNKSLLSKTWYGSRDGELDSLIEAVNDAHSVVPGLQEFVKFTDQPEDKWKNNSANTYLLLELLNFVNRPLHISDASVLTSTLRDINLVLIQQIEEALPGLEANNVADTIYAVEKKSIRIFEIEKEAVVNARDNTAEYSFYVNKQASPWKFRLHHPQGGSTAISVPQSLRTMLSQYVALPSSDHPQQQKDYEHLLSHCTIKIVEGLENIHLKVNPLLVEGQKLSATFVLSTEGGLKLEWFPLLLEGRSEKPPITISLSDYPQFKTWLETHAEDLNENSIELKRWIMHINDPLQKNKILDISDADAAKGKPCKVMSSDKYKGLFAHLEKKYALKPDAELTNSSSSSSSFS